LLKRLPPAALVTTALLLTWWVGMLGRGIWTPDEPREADIAWRMSWQPDKAVPLLAGEAFCEKPPLLYWLAAVPIRLLGEKAWAARLPNLLYALLTAAAVGLLARRSLGPAAGVIAAAAVSTFLLSYQVAIWLATDAPLLAFVSIALLGAYRGFYAAQRRERLQGYLLMHASLGLGFLSKSAVAWMVPGLAIATLVIWERRWRELVRWELYVGLLLQAAMIGSWVWFVYTGPDGAAHLKVFFWNNLVGRFTDVDAPGALHYATGHRNFPGKYLIELPVYLAPWTLLVIAAARQAWRRRGESFDACRPVRFALAASLPPLAVLSLAATARNIYAAPALPGIALLLAWWAQHRGSPQDPWDARALRATAALLLLGSALCAVAMCAIALDAWSAVAAPGDHVAISAAGRAVAAPARYVAISAAGLAAAAWLAVRAWIAARSHVRRAQWALFLAYCALLVGPASQAYPEVDAWQNLASIARALQRDSAGRPLILFAPDETTRAIVDLYARTQVLVIPGPIDAEAASSLRAALTAAPGSLIAAQLPGRANDIAQELERVFGMRRDHPETPPAVDAPPPWAVAAQLRLAKRYAVPNGRRYALFESAESPPVR
jgi:4-amino-4-deoxy-L-arabinose transferase-like glycosyltransferase